MKNITKEHAFGIGMWAVILAWLISIYYLTEFLDHIVKLLKDNSYIISDEILGGIYLLLIIVVSILYYIVAKKWLSPRFDKHSWLTAVRIKKFKKSKRKEKNKRR